MRKAFIALCLAALLPFYAIAQWPVSDLGVLTKVIQETREIVKIYDQGRQVYDQAVYQARYLTNKQSLRGLFMPMIGSSMYGVTGGNGKSSSGWLTAINHGLAVAGAYEDNAITLRNNPRVIIGSPFAAQYASAQIAQAGTMTAMQTLGAARTQQAAMQAPISACQSAAQSNAQELNTNAALLNISVSCQALLLQQTQTSNGVAAAALEAETVQAKIMADNLTEHANTVTASQSYIASTPVAPGNMAASMQTYKDQ